MFTAWLLLLEQNKSGDTCALTPGFCSTSGTKSRFSPEDIQIDLNPDKCNPLYDSAHTGGQQAYKVLWTSRYCHVGYILRFNLEKPLDNVTGHSCDLLFALAAAAEIVNKNGNVRPFAATGVLENMTVQRVDGVDAKLSAAFTVMPEGSIIFYPKAKDQDISKALQQQATQKDIELYPVEHLKEAISKLLGIFFWTDAPYRGLEVFEYQHRPIYFGRQAEAGFLRKRLLEQEQTKPPCLLILGGSGSGKSSFVQAGLIPELEQHFGTALTLYWATWRPGFAALSDGNRNEASLVQSIVDVWTQHLFSRAELKPANDFTELATAASNIVILENSRYLWLIDQLEEIFTLCPADILPGFVDFLTQLQNLKNFWLIATLRNDFYPQYQTYFTQVFTEQCRYDLPNLNATALDQIIQAPADLAEVSFEAQGNANLALQLREDMAGKTEALPLLEFCLRELYEQRTLKPKRMMTYAAYNKMGGLHGAIGKRAEMVFSSLTEAAQNTLPEVLWRLVVWNSIDNRLGAQSIPVTDFSSPARELLDAFVNERLFVREKALVRVTHEALLTHWHRANEELEKLAADSRIHQRLRDLATLWHTDKHSSRLLAAGLPLAEAEDLLARWRGMLEPLVLEFIEASVEAERERQKRDRQLLKEARLREAKLVWLPKAKQAFEQRIYPDCVLYAVRALGFRGYGYEELKPEQQRLFDEEYPMLFDFQEQPELYHEFREIIDGKVKPLLPFWSSSGHDEAINSVVFSPDGRTVVTGNTTIKFRDVANGKVIANLIGHRGKVNCVVFSPDGKTLASSSEDKSIKLWDVTTFKEKNRLGEHNKGVSDLAFNSDGRMLASGSIDSTIKLWDVVKGKELLKLYVGGNPKSITFSPDGKTLAAGISNDTKSNKAMWVKSIGLWDVTRGNKLCSMGNMNSVTSISFSPDGKILASGNEDKTIKLWDVATGKELVSLSGHKYFVASIVFSPNGKILASSSEDKSIKLWDVGKGKELGSLTGHTNSVTSIAFSPDGRTLVSSSNDKTIKFWDITKYKELVNLDRHTDSIAFSSDAKIFAFSCSDKTIKLLDVVNSQELTVLRGHTNNVISISFSSDSKTLASGSSDGFIKLWDIANSKELGSLRGYTDSVISIVFSSDGKTLASVCWNDKTIKLWDVVEVKELANLVGHTDNVESIAFSPDGKILASGSDDETIKLWDVANSKELVSLRGHTNSVTSLAFSPDSKTLASNSNHNRPTKIFNDYTDQVSVILNKDSHGNTSIAFSPDGKTLISSGNSNSTVKFWDVATGKELISLEKHTNKVESVASSLDDKSLASSGSRDNNIKLWDVARRKKLMSLKGHSKPVKSFAFSPDGKILASCSDYETIKLWFVISTLNLANFLLNNWYEFDQETGEIHPSSTANNFKQTNSGFLNVPLWSHIGIMQSADSPEQANRLLFEHYCRNHIWKAAKLLLNEPMDKPVDADWLNTMPDD